MPPACSFANSSFYCRHLMPKLADRFRLIAPDRPLFGFTEVPALERVAGFVAQSGNACVEGLGD